MNEQGTSDKAWQLRERRPILLRDVSVQPITVDLNRLQQLMREFMAEIVVDNPTAYTIPFETFLQWLRKRQEHEQRV